MRWFRRFFANLSNGFGLFKAINPLNPLRGVLHSIWHAGVLRWFMGFSLFVISLFWAAIRWFTALNWRLLLQGAPALIIGAAIITFSIMALFTRTQELELRYAGMAKAAVRAGDFKTAVICYERLSQLKEDRRPDILFEMALACQMSKQNDRCILIMRQLAPPDKPGYPLAQLWMGATLMSMDGMLGRREARQLAKAHLDWALEGGIPDPDKAHLVLGRILFADRQYDEAERYMILAMRTNPDARLLLADMYGRQGKTGESKREAKRAQTFYREKVAANKLDHLSRLNWEEATILLGDFPQAAKILEEGLVITKEPGYRGRLVSLYIRWFDHLTAKGNLNPAERMLVLESGLRLDPNDLNLLNRLLLAAGTRFLQTPVEFLSAIGFAANQDGVQLASDVFIRQRAEAMEARKKLADMTSEGIKTGPIRFALGIAAWEEGNKAAAQFHWEEAYKLAPESPVLANNLAFLLSETTDSKQLNRALDLIDTAIKKMPNVVDFHHTRGLILLKMEKYEKALPELELALGARMPNRAALHRNLAEAYDKIGDSSMAATHRRQADELERKKDKKDKK
jgi:tetratricopeptide (TPR) repeat protein